MADPEPDPVPEKTWIYGDFGDVKLQINLEHNSAKDDVIVAVLKSADGYIETAILEAQLPLPDPEDFPKSIKYAAINYAIAFGLQPPFNSGEDENKKAEFYLNEADKFLTSYINLELKKLAENGTAIGPNPYSVSQTSLPHHRFYW